MSSLSRLEMKYASGGRKKPVGPHPVDTITRAMKHIQEGNPVAAKAELMKSPEAMAHPNVQKALAMMGGAAGGMAPAGPPIGMAEGGEVDDDDQPSHFANSSSPGSPGVLGAIHDAVHAVKDYLIDTPRREAQEARRERIDRETEGYADGGKVQLMQNMMKLMVDHLGMDPEHAGRMASQYRTQAGAVSPVARQMASDLVARPAAASAKKSPAQLAQELKAGFVPPADLSHLTYSDPTLTPLINRYQSGVDNQNLTPAQKQALIAKLQTMGANAPAAQLPTPAPAALGPRSVRTGPRAEQGDIAAAIGPQQ